MRKSHLCSSWSAAAAASYGETIFFTCSSLKGVWLPRIHIEINVQKAKKNLPTCPINGANISQVNIV
ncbi:hypothetical protein OUZ56_012001 [Daphnia magna]|uniref:Secreted protein n=1 Tax=Daphnia magna TaxID=35525 RepID=A0ABQ9Z1R1_9CRUS|nr:hypothetical protein OUZ56_012001 [Daphnia magna]